MRSLLKLWLFVLTGAGKAFSAGADINWMRAMIDAHEAKARETGARIVHACGHDSIPSDLGVQFLQEAALGARTVDLVLSDMAPNMSGMAAIDQAKAMYLAELALEFAREHLRPGGDFLIKLFQGADFDAFVREVRTLFEKVLVRKPEKAAWLRALPVEIDDKLVTQDRCDFFQDFRTDHWSP